MWLLGQQLGLTAAGQPQGAAKPSSHRGLGAMRAWASGEGLGAQSKAPAFKRLSIARQFLFFREQFRAACQGVTLPVQGVGGLLGSSVQAAATGAGAAGRAAPKAGAAGKRRGAVAMET